MGLIVSSNGISMTPAKVKAVQEWNTPRNVKDVQAFLKFANFYRRCIFGVSVVANPLTQLTRKDLTFAWSTEAQTAFKTFQQAFTTAPILMHFNPHKPIIVKTEASNYVSAAVMCQHDDKNVLESVTYFSKKHSPAVCNYEIYDKE